MSGSKRILAIDAGAGTQDVLLYESDKTLENCVKMVLPSQTTIVAGRVRQATARGKDVFLAGNLMGGGPCVSALKKHLRAGLAVYAAPRETTSARDTPVGLASLCVQIVGDAPSEYLHIRTGDVDLAALGSALALFDVELPQRYAIAVQDHGDPVEGSQRRFRFQQWERFVEQGGDIVVLAYLEAPAHLTRMQAVQADVPGAMLMDTGSAAIWGALCDENVAAHQGEGLIVLNVGNQHTIGFLLRGERVWGLFEHHTVLMNPDKLAVYVDSLREGMLTNDEVYGDNGHGAYVHPDYSVDGGFRFVAVTGPNRGMTAALGYYMAVPHGDMMMTGSFGLVAAARRLGLVE